MERCAALAATRSQGGHAGRRSGEGGILRAADHAPGWLSNSTTLSSGSGAVDGHLGHVSPGDGREIRQGRGRSAADGNVHLYAAWNEALCLGRRVNGGADYDGRTVGNYLCESVG